VASEREIKEISKTVSHALRHVPEKYGLKLDKDGWVLVNDMLIALAKKRKAWADLSEQDLHEMIALSAKKRHGINDGKIRALYGHSTEEKIIKQATTPPELLFHGTSPDTVETILKTGLKPMNRQYAHLSEDIETASEVGSRKSKSPVILTIEALKANKAGIQFYLGNEKIWLANFIPNTYIHR
jgi:putative RNA 2'-phosphotransferase